MSMRIEPTGITDYALRAFQNDYWDFHTDAPQSPGTHIWFGVDLRGKLDREALEAALIELRRGHPILRTTYAAREGVVYQTVASADDGSPLPLDAITRTPLRVTSTSEVLCELAKSPFDLAQGPCWRVILISNPTDPTHHVVLFDVHHIGWDALSSPIALADLGSLYASLTSGDASLRPPPEALSYIDLAHALDQYALTPSGIGDRKFWRETLLNAPTFRLTQGCSMDTCASRPPSAMRSARGMISAATMGRLQEACEKAQTTVFVLCLSALARLLRDLTGQSDLCIEIPIAERRYDERLARSLGPFVHCLVVRATIADGAGMLDTVPVHKQSLDLALEHRRAPATDFASPDLRRVGINYLKTPPLAFGHTVNFGPKLRAMGFQPTSETDSQYDLFLYIRGSSVALFGRESLFTAASCDRLLAQYLALLERV